MSSVIVIGAGIAGLAAARTLAEAGIHVVLLEARDRIGGRIFTVPAADGGLPIELGAEFIHGLPPELLQLVDEAALTRFELDGEQRCYQQERLGPCGPQLEVERIFDQLSHLHLAADGSADRTFQEFLVQAGVGPEAAARATSYVEGFNAADARRISLRSLARQQEAEDAISGDRLFRIVEGYAQLPAFVRARFLAAGGELFLSTVVRSIEWKPGSVTVSTLDHRVFRADAAVITLPLGVLQANSVAFTPAPAVLEDAGRLAMGPVARVVYEFDRRFTQLEGVSFLFAPGEIPPTWWTTNPKKSGLVTAWMGGAKVAAQSLDQLPAAGLATLARLLGTPLHELQQHLVRWHSHNWQTDPQSVGAYTYVPAGAIDASDRLSIPVEGTLFFAGEHTDTTGHWGTVHGALRSGYRAAEQWLGMRA